jgi:hypothetical protein
VSRGRLDSEIGRHATDEEVGDSVGGQHRWQGSPNEWIDAPLGDQNGVLALQLRDNLCGWGIMRQQSLGRIAVKSCRSIGAREIGGVECEPRLHDWDPCPKGSFLHRSGNLDHLTLGCLHGERRSQTLLAYATKTDLKIGDQQSEPSVLFRCWSRSLNYLH